MFDLSKRQTDMFEAVLIFKQDADPIKAALQKHKSVRMELAWSLPNPDSHVEWDLWTSPTDYVSSQFKNEFGVAVKAFGGQARVKEPLDSLPLLQAWQVSSLSFLELELFVTLDNRE